MSFPCPLCFTVVVSSATLTHGLTRVHNAREPTPIATTSCYECARHQTTCHLRLTLPNLHVIFTNHPSSENPHRLCCSLQLRTTPSRPHSPSPRHPPRRSASATGRRSEVCSQFINSLFLPFFNGPAAIFLGRRTQWLRTGHRCDAHAMTSLSGASKLIVRLLDTLCQKQQARPRAASRRRGPRRSARW